MGEVKRLGVMTSGGDAPGMNAAIRAVVRACKFYSLECIAIKKGFEGLISGNFEIMDARAVRNTINRGGTILKSARCDEFKTQGGRDRAFKQVKEWGIDGIIIIGGDGSLTGGMLFENEFNVPIVGIPGTIDNDIYGTSRAIGFDTAVNTVIEAVDKIRDTASSHNRLFFIEVMGRDAGHIALNAGIAAGAEEILIPEIHSGVRSLVDTLKYGKNSGKSSSIVIVAEGDKTGDNVYSLASQITEELPEYEVRVSVLGHIQRGGIPTYYDRVLASRMGIYAVETIIKGTSNVMVGVRLDKLILTPLKDAVKGKSAINKNLIRISKILSV